MDANTQRRCCILAPAAELQENYNRTTLGQTNDVGHQNAIQTAVKSFQIGDPRRGSTPGLGTRWEKTN
jgi:hypothetical protein